MSGLWAFAGKDRGSASAVVAAARSVRRFAVLAVISVVALAAGSAAVVGVSLVYGARWTWTFPVVLFASMVIATVAFAAWRLRTAPVGAPEGVAVAAGTAPGLYGLIADTASRLGVRAPVRVVVVPEADVWLSFSVGEPVLAVGGPLLWTSRVGQLQRRLAPEVALMRFADDPQVRRAIALMCRVRSAGVAETTTFGVGGLFRRLLRGLDRRVDVLGQACRAAADEQVTAAGLTAGDTDLIQAEIADDTWEDFLRKWVVPAWERGLAPRQVMLGLANVTAAVDTDVALARPTSSAGGEQSLVLVTDPPAVDRRLSELLANRMTGSAASTLEWADYLERVVAPAQRERAAALFAAAGRAVGEPVPATLNALADLLDDGWAPAVAAQLAGPQDRAPGEPAELAAQALEAHLDCVITTAAVEAGAGARAVDWATGPVVVTEHWERLPTEAWAHRMATPGRARTVSEDLARWGVPLDQPLWLGGSEPRHIDYPDAVLVVWQGWRCVHLVVTDTGLFLLHDPELYRPSNWLKNLSGANTLAERQAAVLHTPVGELPDTFQVRAKIPFADLVTARLKAKRSGEKWRCHLQTPSTTVKISGLGSGLNLGWLLGDKIGDRMRLDGPVTADADTGGDAWFARIVIYAGMLALAFAAFLALLLTGTPDTATTTTACAGERDEYDIDYTCPATVTVNGRAERGTVHPPRAVPPGTPFEVRVITLPFTDPLITPSDETQRVLWPFLVMGTVMVSAGTPFVLARKRRIHRTRETHAPTLTGQP